MAFTCYLNKLKHVFDYFILMSNLSLDIINFFLWGDVGGGDQAMYLIGQSPITLKVRVVILICNTSS